MLPLLLLALAPSPEAQTKYETSFSAYQGAAPVDAWYADQCETVLDPLKADDIRVTTVQQWVYKVLPDAFVGNAASSDPLSGTTSTSERLAAAIDTSVPGTPKVAAGITVRPGALFPAASTFASQRDDLDEQKRLVAGKTEVARAAHVALDAAKLEHRQAEFEAHRLCERPSPSNIVRAALKMPCPKPSKTSALGRSLEASSLALTAAQGRFDAAKNALADATRELTKREEALATAQQQVATKLGAQNSYGRRVARGLMVRLASFEDLGTRLGGSLTLPLRRPQAVAFHAAEFQRAAQALLQETCTATTPEVEASQAEKWVLDQHDAFIEACTRLSNIPAYTKQYSRICLSPEHSAQDTAKDFQKLGDLTKDTDCESCKSLGANPPTIKSTLTSAAIIERALKQRGPNLVGVAAWDTVDASLTLDGFADFEPIAFGFTPRETSGNDLGEAQRLGRGDQRKVAGTLSARIQSKGASGALSFGVERERDIEDDFSWKSPQLTLGLSLQCVFGSLDPGTRLRSSQTEFPKLACAPREHVNPKALAANGKPSVAHVAAFVAMQATLATKQENYEVSALRSAQVAAGLDFLVSKTVKFRLGIPVKLEQIRQKPNAVAPPGVVLPSTSGFRSSFPVFLTTVLAL